MRDLMGNATPPRISESDVGAYWLGPDDEVWQLIAYAASPSVTWSKVGNPQERRDGCVGSPMTADFQQLVVIAS